MTEQGRSPLLALRSLGPEVSTDFAASIAGIDRRTLNFRQVLRAARLFDQPLPFLRHLGQKRLEAGIDGYAGLFKASRRKSLVLSHALHFLAPNAVPAQTPIAVPALISKRSNQSQVAFPSLAEIAYLKSPARAISPAADEAAAEALAQAR
jgi:hypothetical protein